MKRRDFFKMLAAAGAATTLPKAVAVQIENVQYVTPTRIHPAVKAWGIVERNGKIRESFNVGRVSHNGTGDFTIVFESPLAPGHSATVIVDGGYAKDVSNSSVTLASLDPAKKNMGHKFVVYG